MLQQVETPRFHDNQHINNNNNNNVKKGKVNRLWNQQVQTDRTVASNKPDIIIRDNEKGTCVLVDGAM